MAAKPVRSCLTVGGCSLAALLIGLRLAFANHAPNHTVPTDDAGLIASALSAAPESVARVAAVVVLDGKGGIRRLREGEGSFTCVADDPGTPANDPVCLDANGFAWLLAWVGRTRPPEGGIGIGYRLQGSATPSNADPFATVPPPGSHWRQE